MIHLLALLLAASDDVRDVRLPSPPQIIDGQITWADYPRRALRREAEGRVHARLTISEGGRALRCVIAASSGHADLDSRVCDLALTRMRFSPALDAGGLPVEVQVILPVVWMMEPLPAPARPSPR